MSSSKPTEWIITVLRPMSTQEAVRAEGLTKSYGDVHALRGIDLTVPQGTVLGLLGPNGAGKTTAVRILTTLLPPDGGSASVAGPGRGQATPRPCARRSAWPASTRRWTRT